MKVPIPLAILVGICLVGIVVCFGLSSDASTIAGYKTWKIIGIACCVITGLGLGWVAVKSGGK
jgi:hypothetical protein